MKNKRIFNTIRSVVIAFAILLGLFSYTHAQTNISSELITASAVASDRFTPVNFIGPGNDFGGGIIWLTNKKLDAPLQVDGTNISCSSQIRGFYFNSQRGERLWPLDTETQKDFGTDDNGYFDLNIQGGRYTDCVSSDENDQKNFVQYSIFGVIEYNYMMNNYSLIAGLDMDYDSNRLIGSRWIHSLQYINNKTPAGYIYDSAGGIGFVGGRVGEMDSILIDTIRDDHRDLIGSLSTSLGNGVKNINRAVGQSTDKISLFGQTVEGYRYDGAQDSRLGFAVLGTVGVGKAYSDQVKRAILGNPGQQSSISEIASVNSSDRINNAQRKSHALCRGATEPMKGSDINTQSNEILCMTDPEIGGYNLYLDDGTIAPYNGNTVTSIPSQKTVIGDKSVYIGYGDLRIHGSQDVSSLPLDIYVGHGDAIIEPDNDLIAIDGQGFPTTSSSAATSGIFYKMNLVANGILTHDIVPGRETNSLVHKLYYHGKIATLNTADTPPQSRYEQVIKNPKSGHISNEQDDSLILHLTFDDPDNITKNEGSENVSIYTNGNGIKTSYGVSDRLGKGIYIESDSSIKFDTRSQLYSGCSIGDIVCPSDSKKSPFTMTFRARIDPLKKYNRIMWGPDWATFESLGVSARHQPGEFGVLNQNEYKFGYGTSSYQKRARIDDAWNFVVLRFDKLDGKVEYFLNTAPQAGRSTFNRLFLNAKYGFGLYTHGGYGYIDDFRLYNRALSNEEIQGLYELGTVDTVPLSNLFARRCNLRTGKGQDGANCGDPNDQFALVPFVVIDQDYPSRFLSD